MLTINLLPESNKAFVQYPKEARMPKREITILSVDQIERKWMQETRTYIYRTLRKWVLQRNQAYKLKNTLSPQQAHAVDKLLLMLINYQFHSLPVLCRKVTENRDLFLLIFPHPSSRNYSFAKLIIAPTIIWCQEYQDIINAKKSNT